MSIEEKYQKPTFDYYVSFFWRKLVNAFLAYPEFIFLGKIILGFLVVLVLFFLLKKYFGF